MHGCAIIFDDQSNLYPRDVSFLKLWIRSLTLTMLAVCQSFAAGPPLRTPLAANAFCNIRIQRAQLRLPHTEDRGLYTGWKRGCDETRDAQVYRLYSESEWLINCNFLSSRKIICFGLVWFGSARLGLVWFVLVWFGSVCFDLVWFGSVRFSSVWSC